MKIELPDTPTTLIHLHVSSACEVRAAKDAFPKTDWHPKQLSLESGEPFWVERGKVGNVEISIFHPIGSPMLMDPADYPEAGLKRLAEAIEATDA